MFEETVEEGTGGRGPGLLLSERVKLPCPTSSATLDEMAAMNIQNVIQECNDGALQLVGSGIKLALPAPADKP